ncbi:PEP-CTERM protein-sorting domain-containing protein [Nitrosomonas sp. Nm51]|uniref:PEP-CTERM sorting domain-containing protein n=1 Tax=Nitrosomonas sp. Nm51 TaxID=133720 RepID=UPI0008B445BE|nr:PEP-CTERM sorting domain-containing protein [Nitrosomonas sp. Nm51]SER25054.1 PEP-CTERM protein-sorting domain-containing protein [Nitrosomonas sp. Nm51]
MKQTQLLIAALFFAGIVSNTGAAPLGFGVDGDTTDSTFYSIDFATGTGTTIGGVGGVGFSDVEALSFFGNTLYAIDDSSNQLITIDTTTGAGTAVGALGVSVTGPGLAISASGSAFMADQFGGDLWTVNLGTGAATLLNGSIGADLDGLTFLGNTLYGVDAGNDSLYTVDTVTGAASLVGAGGTLTGLSTQSALATDGTWLYAGDDDGDYFRINPATGAATVITTDGTDVEGLAIQQSTAVPLPTTLALLGIGLIGFGFTKRKNFNNR